MLTALAGLFTARRRAS
ncbi:hypothetical protein [Rhodovulum sp. P5]